MTILPAYVPRISQGDHDIPKVADPSINNTRNAFNREAFKAGSGKGRQMTKIHIEPRSRAIQEEEGF